MNSDSMVERTFIETVRTRGLLPAGSTVAAAVSGGSDSVALLRLLRSFASHMKWKLEVLHVDHGARPGSRLEAEFVESLASGAGLPYHLHEITPPESGSTEDHFSRRRQEIYDSVGRRGVLVATGHTADDRAETLIMRLLEGSGLRGLGGMDYFGRDPVRRPLLDLSRAQLRRYLEDRGQSWMEDPTNSEDDYLRNRIRHDVIPVLETISPGSTFAISRSSANLSQWRDVVDGVVRDSLDEIVKGNTFHRQRYGALPSAVRLALLWTLAGRPRGGRLELEKTDRWILSGRDGSHVLPGGTGIVMEGELGRVSGIPSYEEGKRP